MIAELEFIARFVSGNISVRRKKALFGECPILATVLVEPAGLGA
jgi:hypothetical protein